MLASEAALTLDSPASEQARAVRTTAMRKNEKRRIPEKTVAGWPITRVSMRKAW
jgi:hypothetical protein